MTLYGTGVRNRTSLDTVKATVGGVDAPILFAGPQGTFPALDQVNVQIPASVAGRGNVPIVVTIEGQSSNQAVINVR